MLYLIIKAAVSGVLIALISEIARRSPGWGGLLASLPLTSLLAMIWLWRDTSDPLQVADLAASTIWFFLPSLPLFVVVPWLLRAGWGFWPTMLVACALTIALYAGMVALAPRLGIRL
jgi:hypothetical protein